MFSGANTFVAFLHGAGTDPFEAKGTVFAAAFAEEREGRTVNRTDRSTVFVKLSIRSFGVSGVERDTGTFKTEIVFQYGVVLVGIEGGIADEGFEGQAGMGVEEIRKNRLQRSGIADLFINIG